MKLWVAKDERSNYCALYLSKPNKEFNRLTKLYSWRTDNMMCTYMCLPSSEFTNVTFENSPKEVEIKYCSNISRFTKMNYTDINFWR